MPPMKPFVLALAGALVAPLPALAQIALTALSLEARSYETAVSWQERGFRPAGLVEYVHVPGHVLLDVRAVFDGPWAEDVPRISVNTRDIRLILPDGRELEPLGGHATWGQMTLQARSLSAQRPRDYPTEDRDLYWNGIFRVPADVPQVTLRLGGEVVFAGALTVPAATREQDAAAFARFEPGQIRRFRRLGMEDGRGETLLSSAIFAPPGMVLASVEVAVSGVATNQVDGSERFSWHTSNFRLVDGSGASLGLIGEEFMRRVLDSQFNSVNIGDTARRTMIWVVPEDLAEARLLFGETEVARVALGSAGVSDER